MILASIQVVVRCAHSIGRHNADDIPVRGRCHAVSLASPVAMPRLVCVSDCHMPVLALGSSVAREV